ncbi:ABC transporter ATP-binding protein [Labrenzia sp. VG12]|uniref:ABC transporter ATP-binding protein n=1 Tax=Labrenzia sp. VG12 TaxID=2021862 RepID=UPI000B8C3D8D|nr:ABC transporter ATP-binding protein [Labrenzia sp. VG12]ASP35735.1 multidrug ABC transporter ATP-binding protein [Labrenzia sp. VG12]
MNTVFSYLENIVSPFKPHDGTPPPSELNAFYWHFIRQIWKPLAWLMAFGFVVSIIEVALFEYLGRIIDYLNTTGPDQLLADHGGELIWMLVVVVLLRPLFGAGHTMIKFQIIEPAMTNLIRWQTHKHVLGQSLTYFNNDFAGRIANKIIQTGPSLRGSVVSLIDAIWFVLIYVAAAIYLFLGVDAWLILPLAGWLVVYVALLVHFVPKIKDRSAVMSEARSSLTGRIVDSYTNILTVKLFAAGRKEEAYTRASLEDHTRKFHDILRPISQMVILLWIVNGIFIASLSALGISLWQSGLVTVGSLTLAITLSVRIVNMSAWIMWITTDIFENVGTVQEGMQTISKPHTLVDRKDAKPLAVSRGEIIFDKIRFHYGKDKGVIEDLSLQIAPGEKVGLVGRSGAGKSTLVNLLMRFYDLEGGRILIDGQDIAGVTQDSLRAQIGMVTQDTSLLHRSVLDNIVYGRSGASREEALRAAEKAHALSFIPDLEDFRGRRGLDAHVGERGVKLSGGQRQRIAIARVLLKDAPILVLDEATSALDSEVEAAIQESLFDLMKDKTVIAIAHRLSTIAAMDRLIIMDQGRIIETGSHQALLQKGGVYAQLWNRQSGGFLDPAAVA